MIIRNVPGRIFIKKYMFWAIIFRNRPDDMTYKGDEFFESGKI